MVCPYSPKYIACHNAVLMQYSLLAESSRVLTRTLNLLFTVTLVLSVRVTLPPSFTMYTSGSKYTPATAHKGRGASSEVNTKVVAMQSRKSKQPQYRWNTPHVTTSRTLATRDMGWHTRTSRYNCALYCIEIVGMYIT